MSFNCQFSQLKICWYVNSWVLRKSCCSLQYLPTGSGSPFIFVWLPNWMFLKYYTKFVDNNVSNKSYSHPSHLIVIRSTIKFPTPSFSNNCVPLTTFKEQDSSPEPPHWDVESSSLPSIQCLSLSFCLMNQVLYYIRSHYYNI